MITLTENQIKRIKQVVGYKGRKPVQFKEFRPGISLNSYWESGFRDYFWFVSLNNFHATPVRQNGTPFDGLDLKTTTLEPNHVLVSWESQQGKQGRLYIYS